MQKLFIKIGGMNAWRWKTTAPIIYHGWLVVGAAFLIALFGAIGTLARYGLQGAVQIRMGGSFPYGTLLINLSGCLLLGFIGQLTLNRLLVSTDLRMAIAVGFFGGYTTFSSFGWETAKMLEEGAWLRASTYVGVSVIAGLLLSVAGIRLANKF